MPLHSRTCSDARQLHRTCVSVRISFLLNVAGLHDLLVSLCMSTIMISAMNMATANHIVSFLQLYRNIFWVLIPNAAYERTTTVHKSQASHARRGPSRAMATWHSVSRTKFTADQVVDVPMASNHF